jgi:CBS domain-containing protein
VHGALDLHPIEKVLHESGDRQVFLAQLVRATTELRPPLGFFRQIVEEEGGVDLKAGGILPLVSLARAWALEARLQARSTLERLELAARAGVLARETAETLTEAFHFLMRLRLREQLRGLRERGTASGRAPLESLTPLERRHLKESFLAIREAQMAAALRFQVSRLG